MYAMWKYAFFTIAPPLVPRLVQMQVVLCCSGFLEGASAGPCHGADQSAQAGDAIAAARAGPGDGSSSCDKQSCCGEYDVRDVEIRLFHGILLLLHYRPGSI